MHLMQEEKKLYTFDSRFESGNLQRVVRTEGREKLMPKRVTASLESQGNVKEPTVAADHEYSMWCRKDLNTGGNIQWYYFKVTSPPALDDGGKHARRSPIPLQHASRL